MKMYIYDPRETYHLVFFNTNSVLPINTIPHKQVQLYKTKAFMGNINSHTHTHTHTHTKDQLSTWFLVQQIAPTVRV